MIKKRRGREETWIGANGLRLSCEEEDDEKDA